VAVVTAAVALLSGLLVSAGVGVGLTMVLVLHELNTVPVAVLGVRPDGTVAPDGAPVQGLLIARLGAPLYTANARTAASRVEQSVASAGRPVRVVVVDATAVGMLLLSAMRDSQRNLAEEGVTLWVASLPERSLAMARRTPGWAAWNKTGRLWPTVSDAVAAFHEPGNHADTEGAINTPAERDD
jgi:SulP family sulfate permease